MLSKEVRLNAVLTEKRRGHGIEHWQNENKFRYDPLWHKMIPIRNIDLKRLKSSSQGQLGYWLIFSNTEGFQTDRLMFFIADGRRSRRQKILMADPELLVLGQKVDLTFRQINLVEKSFVLDQIQPLQDYDWTNNGRFSVALKQHSTAQLYFWSQLDLRVSELLNLSNQLTMKVTNDTRAMVKNTVTHDNSRVMAFLSVSQEHRHHMRLTDFRWINRFHTKKAAQHEIHLIKEARSQLIKRNQTTLSLTVDTEGLFRNFDSSIIPTSITKLPPSDYELVTVDLSQLRLMSNQRLQQLDDIYAMPGILQPTHRLAYVETSPDYQYSLVDLDNTKYGLEQVTDQYGLEGLLDLIRDGRPTIVNHVRPLLKSVENL